MDLPVGCWSQLMRYACWYVLQNFDTGEEITDSLQLASKAFYYQSSE